MPQSKAYKEWKKRNPYYQAEWLERNGFTDSWKKTMELRRKEDNERMRIEREELMEHTRVFMGVEYPEGEIL